MAASLDDTVEMTLKSHIFVESKSGYYGIDDHLPQFIGYDTPK